jgi:hypothetical protein
VLVCYGDTLYLWALRACGNAMAWAGGSLRQRAAVLLAPPPSNPYQDLEKRTFKYEGFQVLPREGESLENALDRFIDRCAAEASQ